jgi:hypothetical protein
VLLGHLLDPPPLPDDVPAVVAALVARAMAKDPKRRRAEATWFGRQLLALRHSLEVAESGDLAADQDQKQAAPPSWEAPKPGWGLTLASVGVAQDQ